MENLVQVHGGKLFCRCPSWIRETKPDLYIKRELRNVEGESGETDIAALFEEKKNKRIIYEGYSDTTCLVELDEKPINCINPIALEQTLTIAKKIFKMRILDELHVTRKTIIDGSNTSGFQRTVLVSQGTDKSFIEIENEKIKIKSIFLEEDSARTIKTKDNLQIFRVDRLGIPLIEIKTAPDIKHPKHAKKLAKYIGELLRITKYVKRGLGTIRQDLNVSIEKGTRVEIKGVQDLELIDSLIYNEAMRQFHLLQIINELSKRNLKPIEIKNEDIKNLSAFTKTLNINFLLKEVERCETIFALKLPKFSKLLEKKLQPGYDLCDEISSISKAIFYQSKVICPHKLIAIGFKKHIIKKIETYLCCKVNDTFILLIAEKEIARKISDTIKKRIIHWLVEGLTEEVRKPNDDGTTTFLRPLSSDARIYPETDLHPIKIINQIIKKIDQTKFETPNERIKLLREQYNLSDVMVKNLYLHKHFELFKEITEKYCINPNLIATTLIDKMKYMQRKGMDVSNIDKDFFLKVFQYFSNEKISSQSLNLILEIKANNPNKTVKAIINENNLFKIKENELKEVIERICKENRILIKKMGLNCLTKLVGKVMSEINGRAEGNFVASLIEIFIKKHKFD